MPLEKYSFIYIDGVFGLWEKRQWILVYSLSHDFREKPSKDLESACRHESLPRFSNQEGVLGILAKVSFALLVDEPNVFEF